MGTGYNYKGENYASKLVLSHFEKVFTVKERIYSPLGTVVNDLIANTLMQMDTPFQGK